LVAEVSLRAGEGIETFSVINLEGDWVDSNTERSINDLCEKIDDLTSAGYAIFKAGVKKSRGQTSYFIRYGYYQTLK
jgi:hypothetical protein